MAKDPAVIILHDAGGDGTEILKNRRLIQAFRSRGYAVIVPVATKRKYVRHTLSTKDNRTGSFAGQSGGNRSKRKYVMQTPQGDLRTLRAGRNRGWYFANADIEIVTHADGILNNRQETPKGRDEAAFIFDVLSDVTQRFWVDDQRVVIVGLGHGGALAWQLACTSPDLARIFAPVNGAYWMEPPKDCAPGGHVIHTHHRTNAFWPMDGTPAKANLFGQTGVWDTAKAFAETQTCGTPPTKQRSPQLGVSWHIWKGCKSGSAQLTLLDGKFEFQDWWIDDVLRHKGQGTGAGPQRKRSPAAPRPKFMKPKNISKI